MASTFVESWMRKRPNDAPTNCIAVHSNDRELAAKWSLLRAAACGSWKELFSGQSQATGTYNGTLVIACWNIAGNFALKCRFPEVQQMITRFDIVFILESWLTPGQEESLLLPPGYTVSAASRPFTADYRNGRGGVLVIVKAIYDTVKLLSLNLPCSHDILCLDCGSFLVLAAYLIPDGCPWRERQDFNPETVFQSAVAEGMGTGKPLLLLGDLNARTGSKQTVVPGSTHTTLTRFSEDDRTCPRGHRLLSSWGRYGLRVINGTTWDSVVPGIHTCYRANGNSVVDYAVASDTFMDSVLGMSVERDPVGSVSSDHAMVCVRLLRTLGNASYVTTGPANHYVPAQIRMEREERRGEQCPVDLDRLVREVVSKAMSNAAASNALYGRVDPVLASGTVRQVYIAISETTPACGIGVFFGYSSAKNFAVRGPEGASRDVLVALGLRELLDRVERTQRIVAYIPSAYVVRAVAYQMASLMEKGWVVKAGSVLKEIAIQIRKRCASLELRILVPGNGHHAAATILAAMALSDHDITPVVAGRESEVPAGFWGTTVVPNKLMKVVTAFPEMENANKGVEELMYMAEEDLAEDDLGVESQMGYEDSNSSHRGRAVLRRAKADNLQLVINASSNAAFWKIVKEFLDHKRCPSLVSPEQLHASFSARLNPPSNRAYHVAVQNAQEFSANLPLVTVETSARTYFTDPVSVEEIQWAKRKLKKKSSNAQGAAGLDGVTTKVLLRIADEDFAAIIRQCISRLELPSDWLCTTLIGILKPGKAASDPEGYRLIGLESCFLKFTMMIFDQRLRKWAEARELLPPTQNGFRPGYRTHNNSFILRAAIDCAKARGRCLYVVFVDLKNAFPSTVLDVLWRKLHQWGARGPWMDWVRKLYREMEYVVIHEGICGEFFSSIIGLLTGDNSSPGLWNIYFSDLRIPDMPNDVYLDGIPISHLEQADDLVLFSHSPVELQAKLDCFVEWCAENGMELSVSKTKWIWFGSRTSYVPGTSFGVRGQGMIDEVHDYKYVGVTFSNTPRKDPFHLHYDKCASKARSATMAALSLQQMLGSIPPHEARQLYYGRIDPFLTLGAEVVIDVTLTELSKLETVQKWFLRRVLGLNATTPLHQGSGERGAIKSI